MYFDHMTFGLLFGVKSTVFSHTVFRGGLRPFGSLIGTKIWTSYSLSDISHSTAHTYDDAMTTRNKQLTLLNNWIRKVGGKMQVSRMLIPVHINIQPVHINSLECLFIFQCKVRKLSSASRVLFHLKLPVQSHFLFQCRFLFFHCLLIFSLFWNDPRFFNDRGYNIRYLMETN